VTRQRHAEIHALHAKDIGDWRDYDAFVGHPGRSSAGMHVAAFDRIRSRFDVGEPVGDGAHRDVQPFGRLGGHGTGPLTRQSCRTSAI
jgi:hypothetical protein